MLNFNTKGVQSRPAPKRTTVKSNIQVPKRTVWDINNIASQKSAKKVRISK